MKRTTIKKAVAVLLAAVMTTGMLTSCGEKAVTDGKTTLTIGFWPTKGEDLERMNKIKDDFEAKYPDIKINPDSSTWTLDTMYPKAEAGTLPDTFSTAFTEFQKLTDAGYVADLTDVAKSTGFYDNINPRLREMCTKDGKLYAFPSQAYAVGLLYNVSLLEEAGYMNPDGTPKQPKDWYELAEMAKHIKEVTGVPGFALETSNNCGGWFMTNIGWSFGVDWMEQDADGKWKATFDTQEAVDTLQFIKDLKWKYDCVPASNMIDQEEAIKLYATGKAAMILDGPVEYRVAKYEMNLDDFGMMAIPAGPKAHVSLAGGAYEYAYKNTTPEQIDAIFKWFNFMGWGYEMDDDSKEIMENDYKTNAEAGVAIGVHALSPWSDDSEQVKFKNEMIEKYRNVDANHVKLYEESLRSEEIELKSEEPVCTQDLYGLLDNLIQEVYSNENADCAALIKQANADFQKNFLDKLD